LPGLRQIWSELTATWPMVSASYGPLLVLLLTRLAAPHGSEAASSSL
jgi:hypothetical protein